MTLSIGSALADAVALWRADRDLITRIAGVFYLLPFLAFAMLATGLNLPESATQDQVRDALTAFQRDNIIWLLLVSLLLDFGTFALLNLFARRGLNMGELLQGTALRMLPFALLGFANGAVIQLGFTLFVIPGIYVFGRTWLMGAAYAAEPERGLLGAIERGFRLSAGNGWRLALLGLGIAVITMAAVMLLLIVLLTIWALAGKAVWLLALLLVPVAAAATAAHIAFTLVRIAAYRRLAGASSGT